MKNKFLEYIEKKDTTVIPFFKLKSLADLSNLKSLNMSFI